MAKNVVKATPKSFALGSRYFSAVEGLSPRQERQRLKTLKKKFTNGKLDDKSELLNLAIKNLKIK